jgi:LuxR family maltose regulon positive regulatory protein
MRVSLVPRLRLLGLLSGDRAPALTLVCAPAGYGKTTLLTEWIASLQKSKDTQTSKVCWLSLDEGDNDPALFLNYLVAAFRSGNPQMDSSEQTRAMLNSFPLPPLQAILGAIINELNDLTAPVHLVLDDYQCITNPMIHEGMTFFLDHLPSAVHLVIATRLDPPLTLARLRARNQLTEIRAAELRFTLDEIADFFIQIMKLPVSAEDISILETRTEGWIAGLQMAALSMQGRSDISQFIQVFSGSHRYILDYLAEEVLSRQSEDVRNFLLTTSILERLSGPLCDAILGEAQYNAQEILEYLDRSNLFLIALDDERTWFRYHHLFADLLRARLRQSQPARVTTLHLLASDWFDQNGFTAEAIQHSLAAADHERAANLIEQYGPVRWSAGDPAILMLLRHLPSDILNKRPRLGLYQAWMLIAQGQSEAALALLNSLKKHLPPSDANADILWVEALIHLLNAYADPEIEAQAQVDLPDYHALERIPEQDLALRNSADFLYAIMLNRQGAFDRAAQILRDSLERSHSANQAVVVSLAVPLLARIVIMQGRLPEAAALCQKYLETGLERGKPGFYSAGSLNIVLGEVLLEWNDLENAEQQIRAGIRANTPWQNVVWDAIGYSDLVVVQSAKGDLAKAVETWEELKSLLHRRTQIPDIEEELATVQARLWLAQGDQQNVDAWADQVSLSKPLDHLQGWPRVTLARVRLAQGRYREAQHILETLSKQPGARQRPHRQVRIDLLLALALYRQNQLPQALQELEACFVIAEPGGYCRVFLDSGSPAKELLVAYLRSPAPRYRAYAQKLVDAFPSGSPSVSNIKTATLVEPLTSRESEVLGLMAAGFSNRQIAEKLILSEGTVKFHVHSILVKIGVNSRTQAIIKGKELKLV